MFYVYLLRSKSAGRFYVGFSMNLRRRLDEHLQGRVYSTRRFTPWELVYYEAFVCEEQAKERERKLKDYDSAYTGLLKRLGYK